MALSFAFRAGDESTLPLSELAVGIATVLVILQRLALWMLARGYANFTPSGAERLEDEKRVSRLSS